VRIEFTYLRDRGYFRAQLKGGARLVTRVPQTVAQLLIAAGVAVSVVLTGSRPGVIVGAGLLVLGVLVLWPTLRHRRRMVTVPDSWLAERRWLISDVGFETSTARSSASYAWSGLRLVEARPEAYLMRSRWGVVQDIPRAPLTPAQDAELGALVRRLPITGRGITPVLVEEDVLVEFTSRQPSTPVGTRLAALHRRAYLRRLWIVAAAITGGAGFLMVSVVTVQPYVLILAAAAIVLSFSLGIGLLWRLARLRRPPPVPVKHTQRYVITAESLRVSDGEHSVRWTWPLVGAVTEWPETYVLEQENAAPFLLPRDTMTEEQNRRLRALLRDRGLLPA
jgi:hypothetical protein